MNDTAISLFVDRAFTEEGLKLQPYDDATGKAVAAPVGNLSWGIGFNLMQCGSKGLFMVMLSYLCQQLEQQLSQYAWYLSLHGDPVRQSVLLDMAYNAGVHGLLHFPKMLAAIAAQDWTTAAAECKVADARLDAQRYAPLRELIIKGTTQS